VFAEGTFEFVHADVLLGHMRENELPVVNQQALLALDQLAKTAVGAGKVGDHVIHHQQSDGSGDAAEE
jgi:hypothetical protein